MVKALVDTNILIDYLAGEDRAREELDRYADVAISIITWMEVMVGVSPATDVATRAFLSRFTLMDLDETIAEDAIRLRRKHRMKLPDAIVWASAHKDGRLFVTRNSKDFPVDDPGVRLPYWLG
jgi:predicted nucleic acid-binding protein